MPTAALQPPLTRTSPEASKSTPETSRTTTSQIQLQLYSCLQCKHRKVKCDRVDPCSNCQKADAECIYRTPVPPKRKKRKHQQEIFEKESCAGTGDADAVLLDSDSTTSREQELLEKVRKYESLLKELGALKRSTVRSTEKRARKLTLTDRPKHPATETGHTTDLVARGAGKLIADYGRSRYLENKLWTSVTDEFQDPKDMLEESSQDEDADGDNRSGLIESEAAGYPSHQGQQCITPSPADLIFPPKANDQALGLRLMHPEPTQIFLLWQAFVDNVNPLVKIIHVPTAQRAVLNAMANLDHVSKGMEALLFGIYVIAVTSMEEGECQSTLLESKVSALKRFRSGAQLALKAAGILKTSDMMVLQGFVLFLLSARLCYDAPSLWSLTGICQRIGQRIGLHRDGERLSLSPFETEMRRRLWLVIVQLDSRVAELSGSGLSIITQPWDTKPPLNVNDCDLYPGMQEPPTEQVRASEMMFVLLRAQIGIFLTKEKPVIDTFDGVFSRFSDPTVLMAEKKREIDELEQMLEESLILHCDPQIPLHQITSVIAKATVCKMRLFAHLPRVTRRESTTATESVSSKGASSAATAEETLLFENSLQILRYHIQIRTTASLRRFLWHTQFQWQALIYLLAYLRTHPSPEPRTEAAWTTLDTLFTSHPEILSGDRTQSKLCTAVSILTLKAWEARENESRRSNNAAPGGAHPPSWIAWLRGQGLLRRTAAVSHRVVSSPPKAPALAATIPPLKESQTAHAHATDSPSKGGNPPDHEIDTFNPIFPLDINGGGPQAAIQPFNNTTTTAEDLSWIDANPMDWENWNSIYESFEIQEQWGDAFGYPAPFLEQ
ncbi:uncharacterized protein A1O9_00668 [Exophiala aquamarina CBS 119918]|uniref:Zn(2)-C6 fungal-type domain-containing protein n=1 Tax=Exophiala aquamarina CBS 119918 TaxID=1182545 RepID=A0A072Q461_9EURO|nr:uncharacterized protein A1O9_00668 [Exophiala aquamarina CBS 119918]KEF62695.1 hypothetical protein A1O9_00668 [Exophiala aquamarina CBS 119918]